MLHALLIKIGKRRFELDKCQVLNRTIASNYDNFGHQIERNRNSHTQSCLARKSSYTPTPELALMIFLRAIHFAAMATGAAVSILESMINEDTKRVTLSSTSKRNSA